MKRPGDQAKCLFVYLLRSSANALAHNHHFSSTASSSSSSSSAAAAVVEVGHICLRLARRTDVASIQKCNLATLPENYNAQFYNTHIHNWPDLALVAEHVVPREIGERRIHTGSPHDDNDDDDEPNIVGYVLGKVEERSIPYNSYSSSSNNDWTEPPNDWKEYNDFSGERYVLEPTGHVTSLAVLTNYRRRGVAASLLNQLHTHMEQTHRVRSVGLHVRRGNTAATQLYHRAFGYDIDQVLDHYYADGEPAYFMRKVLEQQKPQSLRSRLLTSRPRPWLMRDSQWQLPRIIWHPPQQNILLEEENEAIDVQVMTGT